jgi:heme exporter protein A
LLPGNLPVHWRAHNLPLISFGFPSMLEADNLECVRGERRLFAGLNFRLEAGELLYLQGRNGAGKTSLLRMLIGLLPPESGEIRWQGRSLRDAGDEFRADLCYLGHLNAIKEELTPLENLLAAARLAGEELSEDEALDALEQVGLAGREDLACKYLSQGQKRRVALARLVKEKRPLWILDEPFVALDFAAVDWLAGLISSHLQRGGLAVMTTHQPVNIAAGAVRELKLG